MYFVFVDFCWWGLDMGLNFFYSFYCSTNPSVICCSVIKKAANYSSHGVNNFTIIFLLLQFFWYPNQLDKTLNPFKKKIEWVKIKNHKRKICMCINKSYQQTKELWHVLCCVVVAVLLCWHFPFKVCYISFSIFCVAFVSIWFCFFCILRKDEVKSCHKGRKSRAGLLKED